MRNYVALIAMLSAFPALSTDMYLPALPILQKTWGQPLATVNLTLIAFFVTYCFFMLIYGPVSDRIGRRKPLLVGISFYVIACAACAASTGVWMMVGFRALQAAGAAAGSALALAIAKDVFESEKRAQVIAYVSVIIALAPMLGPIIGGWIMTVADWPWVFAVQGFMGLVALATVWRMAEPLRIYSDDKLSHSFTVYFRILANPRFTGLNVSTALMSLPFFAFIAGSSDIYITHFGLSATSFGYFFAFNALSLMSGSFIFARLTRLVSTKHILTISFAGILVAGLWMALSTHTGPWDLALPMWVLGFCAGLSRPPATNLILDQVDHDTGSASSLIAFSFMMLGALGMFIVSLDWADKIEVIGMLGVIVGGVDLVFWGLFRNKFVIKR